MNTNIGSAMKSSRLKEKDCALRKKNVQVVVRTRPMSETERLQKNKSIVGCDSVSKLMTLKTQNDNKHNSHSQANRTFGPFDKVYGPETTQIQLYTDVVAPLMREILNGYNCTVFAYGQTGSGKTFTMEGRHDDSSEFSWDSDPTSGIIPRALHQIFTELGNDDIDFTVRASYVELYNEQIYDLLSSSEGSQTESLRIFDDKSKGVSIVGAEEVIVRSRDEVYSLLKRGAEKRRTAETLMNLSSSRSHSVFTVSVMIRETGLVNGEELLRHGKLNLVDLAGSENIGRSGATDRRAREAGNINTSLLALGRVINALTTSAPHIPYRESKLTRILQDSLGGKTITTIIATLSPASSNFEESVNTLEYAQRAKNIKNNPEVNQKITRRGLLKEYNEEIERLRRDLMASREKHGIYLDKENYDNMVETIDEQSTKVDELENQLAGFIQRVNTLVDDFRIMDEHYESVYQKCCTAMEKLQKRKAEIEFLNKDLAQTKDNVKAANKALSLSENSFVRLRAQASKFQSNCIDFYRELGDLHGRFTSMRQTFYDNEQLLEEFCADLSSQYLKRKRDLEEYVGELTGRMDKARSAMVELDVIVRGTCNTIGGTVAEQKEATETMLQKFTDDLAKSQEAAERFIREEFKRIQSTGSTPCRRETNSFMEELVNLPPAQMLFDEQRQLMTPRRTSFYRRARDSILDTSDFRVPLVSPNTLRSGLPGQSAQQPEKLDSVAEAENSRGSASTSNRAKAVRTYVKNERTEEN